MQSLARTTTASLPGISGVLAIAGLLIVVLLPSGVACSAPLGDTSETPKRAKKNLPRHLEGHWGEILSLAFSPDGKQLIAGGLDDPTVPVWDLTTDKLRYELPSREGNLPTLERPWHEGAVRVVAYSPDGTMIATACGYHPSKKSGLGRILLWEAKTGTLVREIPANRGGVFALAFSPDGKRLLSGGGEDTARIWDVGSGKEVRQFVLDNRSDHVVAVAFSSDGKMVVLGTQKKELVRGEADSGRITSRSTLRGGGRPLLQVLAAGKEMLCLDDESAEYIVRRYALREPTRQDTAWRLGHARGDSGIPFWAPSPDGKTLALPASGGIALWSLGTGKQLVILDYDERAFVPGVMCFSPDGRILACSGGKTTSILLWDASRARLGALWSHLTLTKDADAEAYMMDLAALPQEAVGYLGPRLKGMAEVGHRVREDVRGLDADDFEKREKATRELQALGQDAAFALELALEDKPSPEARKRIEAVLAAWSPPAPAPPPVDPRRLTPEQLALWKQGKWPPKPPVPSEALALKRAFTALVKMGTPEARGLLKELSETAPEGAVRDLAKSSLERLPKPKSPGP
jgi:WD40 repeat protein